MIAPTVRPPVRTYPKPLAPCGAANPCRKPPMPTFHGKVLRGTQVVADDVDVTLWTRTDGTWGGILTLPIGHSIDPSGPYCLELDDGRSGEIVVTIVSNFPGQSVLISFHGQGPPP